MVINGDLLTRVNLEQMLVFHDENRAVATMGIRQFDYEVPFGVVEVDKQRISSLHEKPIQHFFVNAGVYALESGVLDQLTPDTAMDMPDLFQRLMDHGGKTCAFPIHEYWLYIGRMNDYDRANGDFTAISKIRNHEQTSHLWLRIRPGRLQGRARQEPAPSRRQAVGGYRRGTGPGPSAHRPHVRIHRRPSHSRGGAGKPEHLLEVLRQGRTEAVALAAMLHYDYVACQRVTDKNYSSEGNTEFLRKEAGFSKVCATSLPTIKSTLAEAGLDMRLETETCLERANG